MNQGPLNIKQGASTLPLLSDGEAIFVEAVSLHCGDMIITWKQLGRNLR